MNDKRDTTESRALIPIPERALTPAQRWLPLPMTRRAAVVTAVGAAGAIGTFFLKRLGELVAEDVYRRIKHSSIPTIDADPPRRTQPQEIAPASAAEPASPEGRTMFVRLVSVQRMGRGPYFRQRMRIRQGFVDLQDDTQDTP